MFKATVDDATLFKNCFKAVSSLISEGTFKISEDGVELVATDPAMVAMVDLTLDREAFADYEADEQTLGVNIEEFYTILRRANSGDTLSLELKDDENKLAITIENGSTRRFSLPLLNVDEANIPDTQDLDFTATADVASKTLDDGFGDAAIVGDSVTINASPEGVVIQAESDSSSAEFTIADGSNALLDLDIEESVQAMFSLDYLNKIMKAKSLSDNVTLRMGNDFPLRIEFSVPDKAGLNFVLAPRIEEE